MKPYGGPRSFRSNSLESLGEKLDRAFAEVDRIARDASAGVKQRWETFDTIRGSESPSRTVVAKPGLCLELDTEDATGSSPGPTIVVTLPPVDRKDIGLECGLLRLFDSGTITLFPIDGALLGGSDAPETLSTDPGLYVLLVSSRGYWLRRG